MMDLASPWMLHLLVRLGVLLWIFRALLPLVRFFVLRIIFMAFISQRERGTRKRTSLLERVRRESERGPLCHCDKLRHRVDACSLLKHRLLLSGELEPPRASNDTS
jgi:hypothetical protein